MTFVHSRHAQHRAVGEVQQLVRHRAEDGAAQRALTAGADHDDPAVVPVRGVDQRLGRLLRQHLDDRPDAGPLGLLDRVRHRPPTHLGERPLVRLELLPHPTGRLDPGARDIQQQAPARELARFPLLTVVAGTLGIGLFFGATLTSLTGFLVLASSVAFAAAGFTHRARTRAVDMDHPIGQGRRP